MKINRRAAIGGSIATALAVSAPDVVGFELAPTEFLLECRIKRPSHVELKVFDVFLRKAIDEGGWIFALVADKSRCKTRSDAWRCVNEYGLSQFAMISVVMPTSRLAELRAGLQNEVGFADMPYPRSAMERTKEWVTMNLMRFELNGSLEIPELMRRRFFVCDQSNNYTSAMLGPHPDVLPHTPEFLLGVTPRSAWYDEYFELV